MKIFTLRMLVAKGILSHISKFDGPFRACVHEPITTLWMEFGSSDDLGQFLHVRRLYIDDVETLILYVEVPQIDP